ncbi:TPA: hypothetical protein SK266_003460 [Yersinia enterocolitica]|nr:hypothetical protein [Yersinia enterocolitica]HEI6864867.1 hypothetical protein [Yersinia enterocolitica]
MLSKVCKERLEYLASLKGHVGQAVTMCRVELSDISTELLSLREQLAAINGAQEPVGFVKCDPCAEDCRWDCVDPIYLAGSVTPEGYGSDYFEVYRHPAPLKE